MQPEPPPEVDTIFELSRLAAVIRSGMRQSGASRLAGVDFWRTALPRFTLDRGPRGHDPTWGHGVPDYETIVKYLAAGDIQWA